MIDNLQKLTVKKDNQYLILKGLDKPVYYILWKVNNITNCYLLKEVKDHIKADFKNTRKIWWNEYKIFELQFKDNNFAMRKIDRKRKTNRIYQRHNISFGICKETKNNP